MAITLTPTTLSIVVFHLHSRVKCQTRNGAVSARFTSDPPWFTRDFPNALRSQNLHRLLRKEYHHPLTRKSMELPGRRSIPNGSIWGSDSTETWDLTLIPFVSGRMALLDPSVSEGNVLQKSMVMRSDHLSHRSLVQYVWPYDMTHSKGMSFCIPVQTFWFADRPMSQSRCPIKQRVVSAGKHLALRKLPHIICKFKVSFYRRHL